MHWALGEADMCRRAHVLPFPLATNRPEPACLPTPSAGRVAQRDRMRGSTRVFEGHDITTITSPSFHSVNGNQQPHLAPYPMSLPGIDNGQTFPGYNEGAAADIDNDTDNEDRDGDSSKEQLQQHQQQQHEGPPVRRRRLGNSGPRLPGVAELDRSIAADFAAAAADGGRMVVVKQEDGNGIISTRRIKLEGDRRGSTGTGISTRRSR